jgi:hypothetical protein
MLGFNFHFSIGDMSITFHLADSTIKVALQQMTYHIKLFKVVAMIESPKIINIRSHEDLLICLFTFYKLYKTIANQVANDKMIIKK